MCVRQSDITSHESALWLRMEQADDPVESERRSSEPYYVNVGLGTQPRDWSDVGDRRAKSRSVDSITEESGFDDSLDLVITEPDYSTQFSDSQKCAFALLCTWGW